MRTIHRILFPALAALFSAGCAGSEHTTGTRPEERPYVMMTGSLERAEQTPVRDAIDPRDSDGLPNVPLIVGIMTLNYASSDPATDKPDEDAWMSATANLSRGYFGGPGPNIAVVENGEINYTNESGTSIRRLFYDEGGEHYFTRIVYPFVASRLDQTQIANINHNPFGTEVVVSGLDGSQDVMCSNLAWGNIHNPKMTTDAPEGEIVMSHIFSRFGVKVRVESPKAATQFGSISRFLLKDQPSAVGINMINLDLSFSHELVDYTLVMRTMLPLDNLGDATRDAGYVMAPPAADLRFEVETTGHGWVTGLVSFADMPDGLSLTGYSHDIIMTFMESGEVEIAVAEPDEYWLDGVFD